MLTITKDMENNEILNQVKSRARAWLSSGFDQETRDRVKYLIENDEKELVEAFYRDLEFGTGGLRGIMGVGTNRMNKYTVGMATQGLSNYIKKQYGDKDEVKIVVGHDSRNNSRLFAETAAGIFSANGFRVFLFDDLRPTPELSFAIRHLGAQSGVVITASHNPKEYNGYKVYWNDGGQIITPHDRNIIDEVQKIKSPGEIRSETDESLIEPIGTEIDEAYTDQVQTLSMNPEVIQKQHDLKIVYTPIHGSGVKLVPLSLKKFGFSNVTHIPEQDITDGNFPTVESPNPEEPAAMQMAMKKAGEIEADLVMATDPDADRVGVAVRNLTGEIGLLNGNQTASLIVYYLLNARAAKNSLQGNEFICKTIVTTDLLNKIADDYHVKHFDVLTGFKYIADIIKKNEGSMKFICGGEESYGYLAGDFVRDKDAVISCSIVAEITAWAKEHGKSLFDILIDIYLKFGFYKESLISIVRKGKEGHEEINRMMENYRKNPPVALGGSRLVKLSDFRSGMIYDQLTGNETMTGLPTSNVLQFFLEDGTKISVRPSGTEPKIKYYFSVNTTLHSREEYASTDRALAEKIVALQKEMELI